MPYLSAMLGKRITDEQGAHVGRLEDVVAMTGPKFPVVKGIVVQTGRGRGRRQSFIPWELVREWRPDSLVISRPEEEVQPGPHDVFLSRDLLDRQIVDMDGYKIVRVSDIRIARSGGELRVMGADVGLRALLRRLGLAPVAERLRAIGGGRTGRDRIVPWNLISPVEPMPYDVRLRVPYREFLEIHPSDIADIIEQLDIEQRAKVMALIDDPKAAEVLTHILPAFRPSVAEAMGDERLSDLLEIMPPDEAADIIGLLPREKAQVLLSLMGIEEASVVSELLGYEPDTAGGRMTTEFVAIRDSGTVGETIDYLREIGQEAETIYYVYVVDSDGHLSGVLSLRDLLRAAPEQVVSSTMVRDVKTVEVTDDQEGVADMLVRYNYLAVPAVDSDHVLKGIVTVDDVIDVMREETMEDFAQVSGVPLEEDNPVGGASDPRRWLGTALTFLGGVLGTALFGIFRSDFIFALALVYFVPLALRASNDVSLWSLAAAVRDLGGEWTGFRVVGRVLAREYAYTLAAAAIISAFAFLIGMIWTGTGGTAIAGGIGVFVSVSFAGMLGFVVPLLVRRTRPDPVLGPGRIAGVLVMAASIVSFLAVAGVLVRVIT